MLNGRPISKGKSLRSSVDPTDRNAPSVIGAAVFIWVAAMTKQSHPTPSIDALPPFVTKTLAAKALAMSRATLWRRVKDGTLQVDAGGRVIKESIQRFAAPRARP